MKTETSAAVEGIVPTKRTFAALARSPAFAAQISKRLPDDPILRCPQPLTELPDLIRAARKSLQNLRECIDLPQLPECISVLPEPQPERRRTRTEAHPFNARECLFVFSRAECVRGRRSMVPMGMGQSKRKHRSAAGRRRTGAETCVRQLDFVKARAKSEVQRKDAIVVDKYDKA